MARPRDEEKRNRIIELLQAGGKTADVAKSVGTSDSTVRRIRRDIHDELPAPSEALDKGTRKPGGTAEEHPMDKPLGKRSQQKIVEYSSDVILRDFKEQMEAARILKEMEYKYRQSIQNIGLDWNDFLEIAIDIGYRIILRVHDRIGMRIDFPKIEKALLLKTAQEKANPETEVR